DKKPVVKDRKFSPDRTFAQALETVKQNVKSHGISEETWKAIKDVKVEKDQPLSEGKFGPALDGVIGQLKEAGVPDDVLDRMRSFRDKTFTGQEKLLDAVDRVAGPTETSQYQSQMLRRAYLFKVSPLWLILAVAVVSLAELMLSPMGLSLVSKVAPVHLRGLMMGGWFVATAIGNKLTMIGVFWDIWPQSYFFAVLGAM